MQRKFFFTFFNLLTTAIGLIKCLNWSRAQLGRLNQFANSQRTQTIHFLWPVQSHLMSECTHMKIGVYSRPFMTNKKRQRREADFKLYLIRQLLRDALALDSINVGCVVLLASFLSVLLALTCLLTCILYVLERQSRLKSRWISECDLCNSNKFHLINLQILLFLLLTTPCACLVGICWMLSSFLGGNRHQICVCAVLCCTYRIRSRCYI